MENFAVKISGMGIFSMNEKKKKIIECLTMTVDFNEQIFGGVFIKLFDSLQILMDLEGSHMAGELKKNYVHLQNLKKII